MNYLIDAHCHLHDREFFTDEQAEGMLKRARKNGINRIICIGTSHEDSMAAAEFANKHKNVYWTYGLHPEIAGKKLDIPDIKDFIDDKLVAIGEVGLDYHYDGYDRMAQIKLFEEMLQLAKDNNLPVSFHVREAFDDFFIVISNFPSIKGVVHSFSDNKKSLKKILENTDFYIGVNGLATYSTLPTPPIDRIILETDAPFLTPVPFRGIINEPGYIKDIATWLGKRLDLEYELVEKETTKNAERLFRFPDSVF